MKKLFIKFIPLLLLCIVSIGQAKADKAIVDDAYVAYSYSGTTDAKNIASNTSIDLGTLTANFTITDVYIKLRQDWGEGYKWNNGFLKYHISGDSWPKSGEDGWTPVWKENINEDGYTKKYELQQEGVTWTYSNINGASGSYTMQYLFQVYGNNQGDGYLNNGGSNYTFIWKIAPPDVSGFGYTISSPAALGGTGISSNPYLIANGSTPTITLSGSQAHTDANSTIEYSFDGGANWTSSASSTLSFGSPGTEGLKSITVKARYKNTSDGTLTSLNEAEKTIYYKWVRTITVTTDGSGFGTVSPSTVYATSTDASASFAASVAVADAAKYEFANWDVTSGLTLQDDETSATNTVKATANGTVTANFRGKEYSISYDPSTAVNCTYTTKPTAGRYGSTVNMKIDPNSGYLIYNISAVDASSNTVAISGSSPNYSFTMPASNVTVSVEAIPTTVSLIYDKKGPKAAKASLYAYVDDSETPTLSSSTISGGSEVKFKASLYTGYEIEGWYTSYNEGTGEFSGKIDASYIGEEGIYKLYTVTAKSDITVYINVVATNYSITYVTNGGDAIATGSFTIEDGTVDLPTPTYTGAHFLGWCDNVGLTGSTRTSFIAGIGASQKWGNQTFYAKWGRVSSWNWSGDPTPSAYAAARTYTTKTEISAKPVVTYEYGTLSSNRYTRCYTLMNAAGDAAVSRQPEFTVTTSYDSDFGTVTFTQPIAGTYRLKVELKAYASGHDNCSDPTLAYAISDQFVVENVHKVTLKYVSDGVEICPRYELEASNTALAPTTTRADLTSMGYTFHHWEKGSNITVQEGTLGNSGSAGSNSITYTASDDEVLTEVYTTGGIYFKNTLGWDNVYLYRHNVSGTYWHSDQGTGSKGGTFTQMTKVKDDDTGDIYFVQCTHTNGYVVSFVNQNQSGYTSYSNYLDNTQVVYRTDYHSATPMFVPVSSDPKTDSYKKNSCYYIRGYWAKYNPEKTGYEVRVYDAKTSGNHIETVEFIWADDGKSLKAVANLEASKSLGFLMARADGSTGALYRNTGDYAYNTAGLDFTAGSGLCGLATKTAGDYTFKISCVDNYSDGTEGNKVQGKYYMQVDYPAKNGDYRLYYTQGKRGYSSFGNYRAAGWYHESDAIPQETLLNYVEVYVDPDSVPTLKLQQYTASTNTWADVDLDITFDPEYSEKGITSLAKLPGPGVYKFLVNTKTLDCASAECFCIKYRGKYEGNFYIRTNGVDKNKWDYKKSMLAHQMTYSEYSKTLTNHPFSHYYVKDLDAGTNVRFTVATEHTSAICDTLYHQDAEFNLGAETLPAFANVRFMYNEKKNHISRAFIGGSAVNTFLNVRSLHDGSKLYKEWTSDLVNTPPSHVSLSDDAATYDVDTITFKDNGNWIYEADVYAKPGATIKLTSKYHTLATQFFKGKSGAYNVKGNVDTLIGGTGSKAYPIKMIYDFKINRLTTAWVPSKLEADLPINADLMIVREHQKDAEQIDLGKDGSGNPYDLTKVKTVYGVMQFNKWTINNKSKTGGHADLTGDDYLSGAERALYWISFPFDVNLIDVFGFGEYGKHWILEYYDGKGRAKNGFWVDSESNWKFVEKADRDTFVLKANMGYVLALDLDHMGTSSDIWRYVEDVYLYFPSMAEVASIKSTTKTVRFPDQSDYECKIGRNMRNIKDSYWHCIGVPSFANASHNVFNDTEADKAGDWAPTDLMYLYEWNSLFNTLVPVDTKGKYGTPGSFNFKAMYAYLVQYSKDTMIWNSVVNHPDPSPIVKRAKKATEMENVNFKLELFKGDEKHDHAFICLTEDERVSTAFEFNYDLCKENNAGKGNIWTVTSDSIPVAGNVMPESEQTTILPVGIKTARAGEYTIAIPEGTNGVGVVLIDNITGTRTNLALTDYTVSLTKGATEGRFFLEISPISQVQTDIEQTNSEVVNGARKVIVDGNLYIVKDGKVFDARGNRVK